MKHLLFACILLACTTAGSQDYSGFSWVDQRAIAIPAAETVTTTAIANYINHHFSTEKEKFRAIYSWVTANIRYNTDSMYSINWGADETARVTTALRRRKGVCENYAAIFNDIALKTGLTSSVVTGYTKQNGTIVRTGHVWCAVLVDNKWFFCDPTWDEGFRGNARYFLITPEDFIETHFPFDPLWQLLPYRVTENDFARGFTMKKADAPLINFEDSIQAFLKLPPLEQLEAAAIRMQAAGVKNELQNNWLAYTKMKIAIVHGENDMELYNGAVADLNKATGIFNAFIQYRNNHFTPAKPDAEINSMLDPIATNILAAWEKINYMGKKVQNFQYDTGGLSERLVKLTARVQEQKDFLKRYFASNVADRGKLFYQ
jgi:hypothetical protein